jgi:hypothetical protein
MEPPTSATFVLKMVEYFGDVNIYGFLNAVRKLEKNTGISVYSWKKDLKNKNNSKEYWDDIGNLNGSGLAGLREDNKIEITERGKEKIKELNLELQKEAKMFLEKNYWRNLLYERM